MADLVVGMAKSVVAGAITKAQAAIEEEGKLRQSAARNLVFITGEFQMIQSFLKVADSDRLENPVGRTWVRQIRDLAYNVEDCIEFVVHLDKKNRWWLGLLKPVASCVGMPPLPLDVAVDELDRLKAMVDDVSSRHARYSLMGDSGSKPSATAATNDQHQPSFPSRDAAAAGGAAAFNRLFEAAFKTTHKGRLWDLTQLLTKEDDDLGVISIWATAAAATSVGSGGDLGMASIAWNAYTDKDTCENFACRAWVKVMHPFDPQGFVRSLTTQFYASLSCKDEQAIPVGVQALMKMASARGGDLNDFGQLLMQNRFLVVLEDMQTMAEWESIRGFFPDMKNGSCVILSTQQFEVASLSVGHPYQVLHLNQLSDDHSVYAFFTEGSQYDANKCTKTSNSPANNNGVAITTDKKEAAQNWMQDRPLVGREAEIRDLESSVLTARSKKYQVISVWGISGVGKSALVKNMFCDRIVKGTLFQMYGWVDVAHPFNLWDFSRVLLSNFSSAYLQASETADLCTMGSKNPIVECREILKQYQCMVVIDGLQSRKEWDLIQDELISGSNPHNVIVAVTNDAEIATYCRRDKEELVFNVKGLEADTALELFNQVSNKSEVEQQELISICGGLPRVIVAIASSSTKSTNELKHALSTNNKFMLELESNEDFHSLSGLFGWMNTYFRSCPDSLKPCILYLPIFPRNYLIRRRRLVRRWIAEGYSRDSHDESAEMNGEKQFQDLLNLSIIQQPSALGLGDTRMVYCQVNGFFREYIVSRQMEENLMFELSGTSVLTTQRTGRHLLISKRWVRDKIVFESIDFSRLRSLTVLGEWKSFLFSESMKLLRVLDLEGASEVVYSDLKKMVKLMCRLRFLSLRGCHEILHLPRSIGGLRQLQSLDIRHTSIVTLPVNITKLENLQYIRMGITVPTKRAPITNRRRLWNQLSNCCGGLHLVGVEVPPGIRKLTALHTLGVVNIRASGNKVFLEELKELTHLRKLGVSGISKKNSNKFLLAISSLVHLESLSVQLEKNNEGCLDGIPLPQKNLRSLKLYGLGDRLPDWSGQLTMLAKMDLEIARLTEDFVSPSLEPVGPEGGREPTLGVMKFLNELPGLCILRLRVHHIQENGLDVSVITNGLEEDTFEKMKIFEIACSSSSRVTFGKKTMKHLEQLKVDCCSGSLLFGLEHLGELKEVLLKGSSCSDEALQADLMTKLTTHPKSKKPALRLKSKKPASALRLELLPSSSTLASS